MKTLIETKNAPPAIGPYSQAIKTKNQLFISGQLGLDISGNLVAEDTNSQLIQAMENIRYILEAAELNLNNIVKTTIYLLDLKDFPSVNEIYRNYFEAPYPARSCIQVSDLPRKAKIEIEVIASFD